MMGQEKPFMELEITARVQGPRTGKRRAQRPGFGEIPWQTRTGSLHWGKVFGPVEGVSQRRATPHSDEIDEDSKSERRFRPGNWRGQPRAGFFGNVQNFARMDADTARGAA